jgi:DNA-binding response OmpR family regulator
MSQKKILVIDDDIDVADVVSAILEMEGYLVFTSSNASSGVKKIKLIKPDLIILDIVLPDADGYLLLDVLKNDEDFKNIPIIMLTGKKDTGDDFDEAMNRKANWYIVKPVNNDYLLRIVKKLLNQKLPL